MLNPIWTLAQEVNLTTIPTNFTKGQFYDENGPVDLSDLASIGEAFEKALGRMVADTTDRVKHGKPDTSVTVGLGLAGWDFTHDMRK